MATCWHHVKAFGGNLHRCTRKTSSVEGGALSPTPPHKDLQGLHKAGYVGSFYLNVGVWSSYCIFIGGLVSGSLLPMLLLSSLGGSACFLLICYSQSVGRDCNREYSTSFYHAVSNPTTMDNAMQRVTELMRTDPGPIGWTVEAYHVEHVAIGEHDVLEDVVTHVHTEALAVDSWRDTTVLPALLSRQAGKPICLQVVVVCMPANTRSEAAWTGVRERLISEHRNRDDQYRVTSEWGVRGKRDHSFWVLGSSKLVNWLAQPAVYKWSEFLCCDWVYRVWLDVVAHHLVVHLNKSFDVGDVPVSSGGVVVHVEDPGNTGANA